MDSIFVSFLVGIGFTFVCGAVGIGLSELTWRIVHRKDVAKK